jgi:hypothetical protein
MEGVRSRSRGKAGHGEKEIKGRKDEVVHRQLNPPRGPWVLFTLVWANAWVFMGLEFIPVGEMDGKNGILMHCNGNP